MLMQRGAITRDQIHHRHRCEMRGHRAETDARAAVRVPFNDVGVGGLPVPAGLRHIAVQDAVQLEHRAFGERHLVAAFMDQTQRVAVVGHLLLGTALGRGVLQHQRFQPSSCDDHPSESVG
jgi:hypothetical protein